MSTTQIKDASSDAQLKVNSDGSINVNTSGGGGGGGNAAAGLTGSAVPTSADYLGFNVSGNLVGVSSSNPLPISASGTVSTNQNGLGVFQTSQYSVGVSAVQITLSPLSTRKSIGLKAVCGTGTAIFIGNSSGVTTSTGYPLFNGDTLQMDLMMKNLLS